MTTSRRCPACGDGTLRNHRVREHVAGAELGEFDGYECDACGESFLDTAAMKALEERAKKAGVWGRTES